MVCLTLEQPSRWHRTDAIVNLLVSMQRSSIANIQARLGPLLRLDVLGVSPYTSASGHVGYWMLKSSAVVTGRSRTSRLLFFAMGRPRYVLFRQSTLALARQRHKLVAGLVPREELGMAEIHPFACYSPTIFEFRRL